MACARVEAPCQQLQIPGGGKHAGEKIVPRRPGYDDGCDWPGGPVGRISQTADSLAVMIQVPGNEAQCACIGDHSRNGVNFVFIDGMCEGDSRVVLYNAGLVCGTVHVGDGHNAAFRQVSGSGILNVASTQTDKRI